MVLATNVLIGDILLLESTTNLPLTVVGLLEAIVDLTVVLVQNHRKSVFTTGYLPVVA